MFDNDDVETYAVAQGVIPRPSTPGWKQDGEGGIEGVRQGPPPWVIPSGARDRSGVRLQENTVCDVAFPLV